MAADSPLAHRVRRVVANELNDLITMEAADLVENAIALTEAVMAAITEPPTEGNADDDTTDQGRPGGQTAAETRAGADSREVGAVVSEAAPDSEEGGGGEPSVVAPLFDRQPAYGHLGGGCYA
jgi:hypothetical protein